jgi:hypothetical protein
MNMTLRPGEVLVWRWGHTVTLERSVCRLDDERLSWGHERVLEVLNEKTGSATEQFRIAVAR